MVSSPGQMEEATPANGKQVSSMDMGSTRVVKEKRKKDIGRKEEGLSGLMLMLKAARIQRTPPNDKL